MSHNDLPSDPELSLALVQRDGLARSLALRGRNRARSLHLARSLPALSQLGTAVARHRPAQDDHQLPRFLLDAARRVRESAAAGEPLSWEKPDP